MEFYINLDMIGDKFTKVLQGSQLRHFRNIILGIHKYEIPSCNASRRALFAKLYIKPEREKEESHKTEKLANN